MTMNIGKKTTIVINHDAGTHDLWNILSIIKSEVQSGYVKSSGVLDVVQLTVSEGPDHVCPPGSLQPPPLTAIHRPGSEVVKTTQRSSYEFLTEDDDGDDNEDDDALLLGVAGPLVVAAERR